MSGRAKRFRARIAAAANLAAAASGLPKSACRVASQNGDTAIRQFG